MMRQVMIRKPSTALAACAAAAAAAAAATARAELQIFPVIIDANVGYTEGTSGFPIGDVGPTSSAHGTLFINNPEFDVRFALVARVTGGSAPGLSSVTGRLIAFGGSPPANPFAE